MGEDFSARVGELRQRRKKNLAMGGEERVKKQHERGKLTVRERIDLLFDKGSFVELGLLAQGRDGSDDT
ncbi:MAG TPA: carboxyl transferase domain-containing protein, partial [Candidatus Dormibacteraeota bacterium]